MLLPSSEHIRAYYHLYDVHLDDAEHVPVQQYQLHWYTHWGLEHVAAFFMCVLGTHNNTAKKYVTASDKGKRVCLLSLWREGLSDGRSAVREHILCNGYKFPPNVSQ
jgi:hypothetical protein